MEHRPVEIEYRPRRRHNHALNQDVVIHPENINRYQTNQTNVRNRIPFRVSEDEGETDIETDSDDERRGGKKHRMTRHTRRRSVTRRRHTKRRMKKYTKGTRRR
jgi:hypothetical protein